MKGHVIYLIMGKKSSRKHSNSSPRFRQNTGEIEVERARIPHERDGEVLGIVIQILGDSRMKIRCGDGKERMGRIRGKIRKRMWTRLGDMVIVSKWDFDDNHCDIIHRYRQNEVLWLQKKGYCNDYLAV